MINNRWIIIHHNLDKEGFEHIISKQNERIIKTSNLKNLFTITWKIIKFIVF